MQRLKTILAHPYAIWTVLCLPILPLLVIVGSAPADKLYHILVFDT